MDGLSRHNPIWDQSRNARAEAEGYILATADLLLATDFECGNGCNLRQTGPNRFEIDLEPEPGHHRFSGFSYFYCFGIVNRGAARQVDVILHNNMGIEEKGLGSSTTHAVVRRDRHWGQLPADALRAVGPEDSLQLTLDLPPAGEQGSVVFASDFHWYPYTECMQWIEECRQDPRMRISTAGTSVEGRILPRIDLGATDPGAPAIVMSQTPQPSEATGTWSCRRIVEYLVSGDPEAQAIRRQFRIIVLPATNPDGTVLGLGLSHPSGRFPYFEGRKTADEEPDTLPEMKAVWNVLRQERPWLFIEWHSNNWNRRPGHMLLRYRPALMQNPALRRLWESIDQQLEDVPDTYHGNWTGHDEGIYQETIGFMAVTRLQAIAYMIKHHDKFPLHHSTENALACFLRAVRTWPASTPDKEHTR